MKLSDLKELERTPLNIDAVPQMSFDWNEWTTDVSAAFQMAVDRLSASKPPPIRKIACDCHPWNGYLQLCALTSEEFAADPFLDAPEEMAAWSLYDFTSQFEFWPVERFSQMKKNYESSTNPSAISERFFEASASALSVIDLGSLSSSGVVYRTVPHPDDDREFFRG